MRRIGFSALFVALLGLMGLSGSRIPALFTPRPEIVMAENDVRRAVQANLEMDYAGSATIFERSLQRLPTHAQLNRYFARTLAHLGRWEEAATILAAAAADSGLRSAVESDLERLRALDAGPRPAAPAEGAWERVSVRFARGDGIGAVALLSGGLIATALPEEGRVQFWSAAGRLVNEVSRLGVPVALAADGENLLVADMSSDRLLRVSPTSGVLDVVDLAAQGVHGVRGVDRGEDGSVWVTDFGGGRALRIDRAGQIVTEVGLGGILEPTAVLRLGSDLLVAEKGRDRVLRFDANGRLLRFYAHAQLKRPVALCRADGGFFVQGGEGRVFWAREGRPSEMTPLRTASTPLVTSRHGLAADGAGNLFWGDGLSLCSARRIPADKPAFSVEVLRVEARRGSLSGGAINLTVAVTAPDGSFIDRLDESSFRMLKGDQVVFPVSVENLSQTLTGRRIAILVESSDALMPYVEPLARMLEPVFAGMKEGDQSCVIDVRDTFRLIRAFTSSPELVRRAVFDERARSSIIDIESARPLRHAIEVLAPTDHARAVLWLTSGEDLEEEEARRVLRMALINQVPLFIVHIGDAGAELLRQTAERSRGGYYRLYGAPSVAELAPALAAIRSGRYRLSGPLALPRAQDRGRWFDVTCEARHLTERSFDRAGYYSF